VIVDNFSNLPTTPNHENLNNIVKIP
jgi:hypothetical protein